MSIPDGPSFSATDQAADDRVSQLVATLTLDEKTAMLHSYAPGVGRHGMAPFHTGGESLHGVVASVPGTVFPQAVGLAAGWSPELLHEVGRVVGNELQALLRRDPPDDDIGPNVWAPVVNLLRDPRWGRNEEGYSEDPLLTVALAAGYCRGLQGEVPGRPRAAPTLKHFLAYNHETEKFTQSISLRPRVLREYDLPPFTELVRRGLAAAVMPSYHIVNGRPNHLSEYLRLLRDENANVVVIADGFAPSDLIEKSGYYEDREHAYQAAIRTGLDSFTDHQRDPKITLQALHRALADGLLSEEHIDAAVSRLLRMRVLLGEFDPRPEEPLPGGVGDSWHGAVALHAARQAVVLLKNEQDVLPLTLPRTGRLAVIGPMADRVCTDWYSGELPYRITPLAGLQAHYGPEQVSHVSGVDRIAIRSTANDRLLTVADSPTAEVRFAPAGAEGPTLFQLFDLYDWGENSLSLRCAATGLFVSVAKNGRLLCDQPEPNGWNVRQTFGLAEHDGHTLLRHALTERYLALVPADDGPDAGMTGDGPADAQQIAIDVVADGEETAAAAARDADAVVLLVGTHPQINGREGFDREELCLPGRQERMVRRVLSVAERTAVVLVSGHPLTVTDIAAEAPAMLWTCHGGQEMGRALADVIGGRYAPTGRLSQTWYRDIGDLGDILDYDIIKSRRTYRYFDREPLFPFGHGLTYTSFSFDDLALSTDVAGPDDEVGVTVTVRGTGGADGHEVVQLYARPLDPPHDRPLRQLCDFRRVCVPAGASVSVELTLKVKDLAWWSVAENRFVVPPGRYEVMVGRSATAIEQQAFLTVPGDPLPPRDLSGALVRAVDFDDYAGVSIVDEGRLTGEAIQAERAGAWVMFRNVDLGSADIPKLACARLGSLDDAPATLQVRLGDPATGPLLAELTVPWTEDPRYGWDTVTAPLAPTTGTQDVYLVLTAPARLSRIFLPPADVTDPKV